MQDIVIVARVALSMVFLASSLAKLRPSPTLKATVQEFSLGMVGPRLSRMVARILPFFELGLSLLLFTGLWARLISLVALLVLAVFTVSMTINLLRGNYIRCNCFGGSSSKIGAGSVARNMIMMVGCVILFYESFMLSSVEKHRLLGVEHLVSLQTGILLLLGVSIFVLLLAVGEIDSLLSPTRTTPRKAVP